MSLRFVGSDLRSVLAEVMANQSHVILVKDQGVYFLAEYGEHQPSTNTDAVQCRLPLARSAILAPRFPHVSLTPSAACPGSHDLQGYGRGYPPR